MTFKPLPEHVRTQLSVFEMPLAMVGYLARVYHRAVAQQLWGYHTHSLAADHQADVEALKWLHPRSIWAARVASIDQDLFESCWAAAALDLERGESDIPPVEHVATERSEPWCQWGVQGVEDNGKVVNRSMSLRLAKSPVTQPITDAITILQRVWPAIALETHFLVRCLVYVDGSHFRSATFQQIFGAIFVGEGSLESVTTAFEMLLHEGGHHSLYLRNGFDEFVTNGLDTVRHPLRPDPRPVKGALHAAQALARTAAGLYRWCLEPEAPGEAQARRDVTTDHLAETLGILREKARWTPLGEEFFSNLVACLEMLTSAPSHASSRSSLAPSGWEVG